MMENAGTIGWAVGLLKQGKWVRRAGWNGKGMYLWLGQPYEDDGDGRGPEGLPIQNMVMMRTAQDNHVPWLCSQTDLMAEDWEEDKPEEDKT